MHKSKREKQPECGHKKLDSLIAVLGWLIEPDSGVYFC